MRRLIVMVVVAVFAYIGAVYSAGPNDSIATPSTPPPSEKAPEPTTPHGSSKEQSVVQGTALAELAQLSIKGKAAKTGYARTQFSNGWQRVGQCDIRNIILRRDLTHPVVDTKCKVVSGTLDDPYTGKQIAFLRGPTTSDKVQIDHVVALSNAWQTGAQQLSPEKRLSLANDPLNLIAVDGQANQNKSASDAASWLPPNKSFRCQYIARQIAVKRAYNLWITQAEHDAMQRVLTTCPEQHMPVSG